MTSIWDDHKNIVQKANDSLQDINNEELPNELRKYLTTSVESLEVDPIQHWKERSSVCPVLSKIALKYLSVVGTSVLSERLFSKAGNLLTEKRNCLGGKLLSKQMLLQSVNTDYW